EIKIQNISDECKTVLQDFKKIISECERQWMDSKAWIRTLNSAIEECPSYEVFKQTVDSLKASIEKQSDEKHAMRKEFNSLLDRQRIDFEAKLKAQKEEILAIPSEIPNLRKVID